MPRSLPGLRLSVMIRPRGGDFLYTDDEVALMAEEIRLAREYGADGVVFGLLTPDGEVDETRTAQLVREAEGMEVTFHRAFDMTRDSRQALEAVIRTRMPPGCSPPEAATRRRKASKRCVRWRHRLPGASKSWPEAASVRRMPGCWPHRGRRLHFSAGRERESGMRFRNPQVSMGGCAGVPEYTLTDADESVVQQILTELG